MQQSDLSRFYFTLIVVQYHGHGFIVFMEHEVSIMCKLNFEDDHENSIGQMKLPIIIQTLTNLRKVTTNKSSMGVK